MRDYMDRRVTPPKPVTSPTWGPPPLCKQALIHLEILLHGGAHLDFVFYNGNSDHGLTRLAVLFQCQGS